VYFAKNNLSFLPFSVNVLLAFSDSSFLKAKNIFSKYLAFHKKESILLNKGFPEIIG